MFFELRNAGLIKFSKKVDNLNVQVVFIEEGKTELHIHDFRNLGYQYLKYCGEPYFECQNCGIVTKINEPNKGRKQKYCPGCAVELYTKQTVDCIMKKRNIHPN